MLLACIVIYALVLAAAGVYFSRSVRDSAGFYVAGRELSPGLLFATFLAANLGAGTTVGAAEFGYRSGLSAWWWVGSAGLGSMVLAFAIGPKIYRVASKHNLYTVGDYLELRYDRSARMLMAAFLWVGSLAILAGQLIAMGVVLEVAAGVPRAAGIALGAVIVTIYFTAGGLWGSARVNAIQVVVKIAGFLLAGAWVWMDVGGWSGLESGVNGVAKDPHAYLSMTGIGLDGISRYAVVLVPAFFVSPGLLQKLYGARDEAAIRTGVGLQGLVLLLYSFIPVVLGMAAFIRWPELASPDLALPKLMAEGMPLALGGLMLAAIFSAEISSADAVLFMLSTSVARDLVEPLNGGEMSDGALLKTTRITAAAAGLLGGVIALQLDSILAALTIFYSLLTVSLFVPLLAGLYSTRPGPAAALAGMTAGVCTTLAAHAASDGLGWGIANPAAVGIVSGAVFFGLFSLRRSSGS